VSWTISSGPLSGTVYGSGFAILSDTTFLFTSYGYDVYSSNFTFPTVNLGAGTYYLTLAGATSTAPQGVSAVYWDENNGPSLAFTGNGQTFSIPSESFEITGDSVGAVPEPASLLMLGAGLLSLGTLLLRKRIGA
jgi:hypothetical protein